jgi:uncharacterized damage-inducible protein DinB
MDQAIRRQFSYNDWANRRVASSLRTVNGSIDRPLRLFAHILNAESLWLGRIVGEPGPLPWDERTLDECDRLVERNRAHYERFLDSPLAEDDRRMIDYRTTDGTPYRSSLRDLLQHVLMHGCYHRGQIASVVRAEGGEPAVTDLIAYIREVGGDDRP